jgi:hypothetical protein
MPLIPLNYQQFQPTDILKETYHTQNSKINYPHLAMDMETGMSPAQYFLYKCNVNTAMDSCTKALPTY